MRRLAGGRPATPRRLRGCDASQAAGAGGYSAVALSVAEAMEAGFLPALDEDQADMFTVHPVGVAPVPTRS